MSIIRPDWRIQIEGIVRETPEFVAIEIGHAELEARCTSLEEKIKTLSSALREARKVAKPKAKGKR